MDAGWCNCLMGVPHLVVKLHFVVFNRGLLKNKSVFSKHTPKKIGGILF